MPEVVEAQTVASPLSDVLRCRAVVYWIDAGLRSRCVLPGNHVGLHSDGLEQFNDSGLRRG